MPMACVATNTGPSASAGSGTSTRSSEPCCPGTTVTARMRNRIQPLDCYVPGDRHDMEVPTMTIDANGWIDVSVTVRHGMPHWPDNPPIVLERVMDIGRGDGCNVSRLAMGVHTGTHMDGPVHFIGDAPGLDEMPLEAAMGEARVIEIADENEITVPELLPHDLQPGERVLFRTANSTRSWSVPTFVEDFVFISEPAAQHLAD